MIRAARDLWRICRSDVGAFIGGVVIIIYLFAAVAGPMLVHLNTIARPNLSYLPPSWHHPLGTDAIGVDVMGQVIIGARPIMEVGIAAAIIHVGVGTLVGLASGWLGGLFDAVIMRIVDALLTVPSLPLIIVLAAYIQTTSPLVLALILSVTSWAGLARAVRSQALSLREVAFMDAARMQGLSLSNIVLRQLLPNVGPYVAIHFLLAVTGAIYAEVGLFLLGVAPLSGSNWGVMIKLAMQTGALYTSRGMFYLIGPMAAIVILQMAFVYFSRALDRFFNPRLRAA